jgi:hypothetical protein
MLCQAANSFLICTTIDPSGKWLKRCPTFANQGLAAEEKVNAATFN